MTYIAGHVDLKLRYAPHSKTPFVLELGTRPQHRVFRDATGIDMIRGFMLLAVEHPSYTRIFDLKVSDAAKRDAPLLDVRCLEEVVEMQNELVMLKREVKSDALSQEG
ncbi:MAG TPA: hypothetical protein VJB87_04520 [Candidatus Nanoarchaeia archaeon]|nr:hypothetical protein [Candidatus Nanoarchaeia archaeon]